MENLEKILNKTFNKLSEIVRLIEENPLKILYDKYIIFKNKTERYIKELLE